MTMHEEGFLALVIVAFLAFGLTLGAVSRLGRR